MTTEYTYFNYLDQFVDINIDTSNVLNNFTDKIEFSNDQPLKVTLKNLFEQTQIIDSYKTKITLFQKYQIQDDEKIEYVSYKLYGIVDYWWVIAIFNGINNIFNEWPKNNEQLYYLANKLANEERKYSYDMYYNMLFQKNEEKRNILVLKQQYILDLVWEFRKFILQYNKNNVSV